MFVFSRYVWVNYYTIFCGVIVDYFAAPEVFVDLVTLLGAWVSTPIVPKINLTSTHQLSYFSRSVVTYN